MQEIFDAITTYATAYCRLEELQQRRTADIPIGDQKTGAIAEFYARIYARYRFHDGRFEFGSVVQPGWDIKVTWRQRVIKVQVKTVSAHSKTSRVSPIHPGWNELWLMRLDRSLQPVAFWIIEAGQVSWAGEVLRNRTMPRLTDPSFGSPELRGATDRTKQLAEAIGQCSAAKA